MMDWTIRFRFGGIESSLEYLGTMAAKGWMLEYWQEYTLIFRRMEPRNLRFAMDIIPVGMWKLDGEEHNAAVKEEYLTMYEDMGWKYVENQGRKFIFCTEDETIPSPQTDPESYQGSVHQEHKRKRGLALALLVVSLMILAHMTRYLYRYWVTSIGVALLGCAMCTGVQFLLWYMDNHLLVKKEKCALDMGRIPNHPGTEWLGRGMLLCFCIGILIVISAVKQTFGKYAWRFAVVGACLVLCWMIRDIGPWILQQWMKMQKGLAVKRSKQIAAVLLLCGNLMVFQVATNVGENEIRWLKDGEKPIITAEEIFDLTYEKTSTTFWRHQVQQGLGQLYLFNSRVEDIPFSYRLLVSKWEPVIRSFERNPGSYFSLTVAYRDDSFVYWEEDMQQLDHEALGAEVAWLVCYNDYFSYRYYLEVDGAAIFIETDQEVTVEWLRVICQRLMTVTQ